MKIFVVSAILLTGLIHVLPSVGVLGSAWLSRLYGVDLEDTNLIVLLRHRAILFALLGGFFIYASFNPSLHFVAMVVGLLSTLSFIAFANDVTDITPQIERVVLLDWVCVASLILALICKLVDAAKL